jgi:ketosteroid isomerase-like protein
MFGKTWMPLALALSAAPALAAPLPADLAAAAKAFDAAQAGQDRPALERLMADDFLLANGAGRTENKDSFINDLTDPAVRQDAFALSDPVAQLWVDGAVLGGTTAFSGTDHGKPFMARIRLTNVWARRDGQWRVIYTQMSRAP